MIELIVEDYCQECPEFTPDINRTIQRSWDDSKMILHTSGAAQGGTKGRV